MNARECLEDVSNDRTGRYETLNNVRMRFKPPYLWLESFFVHAIQSIVLSPPLKAKNLE